MTIFTEDLALESLPPLMVQVAAAIGVDATETLINRFSGGPQIYIPIKMQGHMIEHLIGIDAADALARDFGGRYIAFPKCAKATREKRNREIVELKTVKHWTLNQVANATGLTVSSVCRILADHRHAR